MNDTHFDAFAGHMQAALNALEVPAAPRGDDHGDRVRQP